MRSAILITGIRLRHPEHRSCDARRQHRHTLVTKPIHTTRILTRLMNIIKYSLKLLTTEHRLDEAFDSQYVIKDI